MSVFAEKTEKILNNFSIFSKQKFSFTEKT